MFELWVAIGSLSALALVFGLLLGYASRRFAVEGNPVVDQIDDILPQSQCAQCGYPGLCRGGRQRR
jgi:electron transport complex protein RnfB